jgi:hypothetical protein
MGRGVEEAGKFRKDMICNEMRLGWLCTPFTPIRNLERTVSSRRVALAAFKRNTTTSELVTQAVPQFSSGIHGLATS